MKREALFAHFRPEERPFAERVLDWIYRAAEKYQPVQTPFLDPRQQFIVRSLVNREPDIGVWSDGGYEGAERGRMWVLPAHFPPDELPSGLAFLAIRPLSGRELKHPDVLGSLLGLGIKREKLGDLLLHPDGCHTVVADELANFIRLQLNRVGRETVSVEEISREDLVIPERDAIVQSITVASLRVDAVCAEGFRLSRSKASQLIKSGKCKVNWKVVDNPAETVAEQDMISLRGFGRLLVGKIDGRTKKGRYWVEVLKMR
jgi:RNA-binding protein YlmH